MTLANWILVGAIAIGAIALVLAIVIGFQLPAADSSPAPPITVPDETTGKDQYVGERLSRLRAMQDTGRRDREEEARRALRRMRKGVW